MNRYFAEEMSKIAKEGYRKRQGVLIANNIPIYKSLPMGAGLDKALFSRIEKAKVGGKGHWSHKQIAVPAKALGDLTRHGFKVDPMFAIPLPGERWFSKTWRKGRLHAHLRGPYYVIHADATPGRAPGLRGVLTSMKHLVGDVPQAMYKRLSGKAAPPVILNPRGTTK